MCCKLLLFCSRFLGRGFLYRFAGSFSGRLFRSWFPGRFLGYGLERKPLLRAFKVKQIAFCSQSSAIAGKAVVAGTVTDNQDGTVTITVVAANFDVPAVGDFLSIAAASILAKVSRDRLMLEYDKTYPGYGFARHKGYGTKLHYAALAQLGPSPIHRLTFLKGSGK